MIQLHPTYRAPMRSLAWVLLGLLAVQVASALAPGLPAAHGIAGYAPLHTFMETCGIIVSALVFGVGWVAYSRERPGNLLLLACVFLGVGLLDFLHTLSFPGMPDFITPSGPEKTVYFWLAARYLSALGLLAVALRPWRPEPGIASRWWGLCGVLLLVAAVTWLVLQHASWLPRVFVPGVGLTPFKVLSEYLLVLLFLGTAGVLLLRMRARQSFDAVGLFGAVCVMALSEVYFTLYADMTDIFNLLGHVYKIIAFGFVYKSIFVDNVQLPFRRLTAAKTLLEQEALERETTERALADNQERLRMALEAGNHGTYDLNLQTGQTLVSPEYARMLGYDPESFVETAEDWMERLHPDDLEAVHEFHRYIDGEVTNYSMEFRQRTRTGSYLWVVSRGRIVARDAQGKPLRMLGTHSDIAERKEAEARQQLAVSVFSHAREGIVITDAIGHILEVNGMFTEITGFSREEAMGQRPRYFMDAGRHDDAFYAQRKKLLAEIGHWSGEVWHRRKNGERFVAALTISLVLDKAGNIKNHVGMFTDITEVKEQQILLEQIAHYDALTGMPNRVLLADRLQLAMLQSQRRGCTLAVAYLDMDGFKPVNDTYGHEAGDQVLITLAHRLRGALREGDTLARMGGDEFVVLLADMETTQDCTPLLTRLLQAAAMPVQIGDVTLQLSASIGVTMYPQDNVAADQLLRHADQAMYQAKQSGKNRFHLFDVAQDVAVQTQRESLAHIRKALDCREFVLHYQPKVNMRTGAVLGAEALIRWQHPERGLLAPAAFLPVIEGHAISVEIGEWVIETALQQVDQWRVLGLDIGVSVNIGAVQLQKDDFVARLKAMLARYPQVPAHRLELEILETSALEDMTQVSAVMHACQAMGVAFALDDFGTGYSSLTYLKRLPAELLKIDQSFVRDMLSDADDLAIVKGVIGLAGAFRRKVIAEGVETVAHGQTLLALGCELAQGYGIARPMPPADLPGWALRWQPDRAWR